MHLSTIPWPVALLGFLAFMALFGFFLFYIKRQPEEELIEEVELDAENEIEKDSSEPK